MLGTLNGALEVRGIEVPNDTITASTEGIHEIRDRIPVLTEIRIHYTLRLPGADRERVNRALDTHQGKCPTANSLKGAVAITWAVDLEEN